MNFGKWIVVAFILFATFIGTLVTVCVRQDISLVSKEYYKEELDFQRQIERVNNASLLVNKPQIVRNGDKISVRFATTYNIQKGKLKLFCPSNPKMDKQYDLMPGEGHEQLFDVASLQPGKYKASVLWTMNGKEYFFEEIIYI